VKKELFKDSLAAISVGWKQDHALLDLDFEEDSSTDADFNFVMTGSGKIIEVQGTSEKQPLAWEAIQKMQIIAAQGIQDLLVRVAKEPYSTSSEETPRTVMAGFTLGKTAVQRS
jgi:ribonuclease PH